MFFLIFIQRVMFTSLEVEFRMSDFKGFKNY